MYIYPFSTTTSQVLNGAMPTCGKGEELSSDSQYGTQKAFVGGEPEDVGVDDLPAVVPLVRVVTSALLLHVVP